MKNSKKQPWFHQQGGPFVIEDIEVQDPGPGEVLVRIAASGACHSDWHQVMGENPQILSLPCWATKVREWLKSWVKGCPNFHPGIVSCYRGCLLVGRAFIVNGNTRNMCETYRPWLEKRHCDGRHHPATAERRGIDPVFDPFHFRGICRGARTGVCPP